MSKTVNLTAGAAPPEGDVHWLLGIDIGGTNLVVGAVPWAGGEAVAIQGAETNARRGPEAVVADVVEMVERVVEELEARNGATRAMIGGVGIGCPGPVDRRSGKVLTTPNLGWSDLPLRDLVADGVGFAATLDNDANCATFGEWWLGAGRGYGNMVGITLGTGIGGGLVMMGDLVRGASGAAGEIGHMTIDFTGRRCNCGNYGCLEAYCSGPNIAARAREGIEAGVESLLEGLVDGDLDRISAATVYEAAALDDAFANEVISETAKILGAGVANIINVFNPEAVVITGGVTSAGDQLFRPLRAEVRRRAFRSAAESCVIVPGSLPGTAGVIGAAGVFKKTVYGRV